MKRVNPQQVQASNPQQILPHQTNVATNRLEAQQKPTKAEQQTSQQQITKAFQVGGQLSTCNIALSQNSNENLSLMITFYHSHFFISLDRFITRSFYP